MDRAPSFRYEFKYLVPQALICGIRDHMAPFVAPDPFSRRRGRACYPICSLYLDTPDLRLYRATMEGHKNRFKLRIRSYSDDPAKPVYFEVKKKTNLNICKRRAPVARNWAGDFLDGRSCLSGRASRAALDDIEEFRTLCLATGARPVIRVKYLREAYESRGRDPVRITIDTAVEHAVTQDACLSFSAGRWLRTEPGGIVLEIKFTDRFPGWLADMLARFGLERQSVAKYALSVERSLERGASVAPAGAGTRASARQAEA